MSACTRCGKENEREAVFCSRCGLDLTVVKRAQVSGETQYCYKHPKEVTNLSCGRCDKPICTSCAIIGPAGPRCKECAKHTIEFRPGAVVHSAKRSATGLLKFGPWGIYAMILIVSSLIGLASRCNSTQNIPAETGGYEQTESATPPRDEAK